MQTKYFFLIILILIVLGIGSAVYSTYQKRSPLMPVIEWPTNQDFPFVATSSSQVSNPATVPPVEQNHIFTLNLYQAFNFNGTIITPWAVLEDSRCPIDVQCIQAGRVRVAFSIHSPSDSITSLIMQGGDATSTSNLNISLIQVDPAQISGHKIQDNEYRFVLDIRNR